MQVTAHELALRADAERKQQQEAAAKKAAAARRVVGEDEYAELVDVRNVNREEDEVEARSVAAALDALSVKGGAASEDRHPEKRAKAAWNSYYEAQLPLVREEKPGLKLQQYKDMIWKSWQKAPENPLNQARE